MVGDPSAALIPDYYAFGATGFNQQQALTDMLKQADTVNDVRPGEALEQQYGYLPQDGTYGCCYAHGFVSSLLEYDNADFALSQYAAALGDTSDATALQNRANNWVNVYDAATGLLTPRNENGTFEAGVGPTATAPYVEGDAYEYLWDVPNDYAGLFSLLGGNAKVTPELENYLSEPNADGMYAQLTNEFDVGEQNALDYAGAPAGTQQAVNNIRNSMYPPGPAGLANNDDLGANSSAFIWDMLGMYPENAGSGNLVFSSPGFPKTVITLPSGKTITSTATGASPTKYYVSGLKLNGSSYSKLYVPFSTLAKGSTLTWTMSTSPGTWGSAAADAPPSYGPTYPATSSVSKGTLYLSPGQSTTTTLSLSSTSSAEAVGWSATVPSGVSLSPSSGSLSVPAGASASATLTVTAGSTDGVYTIPIEFTPPSGTIIPIQLSVVVAAPGDLSPYYNVTGISSDGSATTANFDGDGYSYSAQALAADEITAGSAVTVGGLTYTWPNAAAGSPDAVAASGQTIPVTAPAGATEIGFLGSGTNAGSSGASGTVTITYTDGTTSTAALTMSDWTLGGGGYSLVAGNTIVATTPYRNGSDGSQDDTTTYVYQDTVPVDGSKTVASVTLPASTSGGAIGIFAISRG
jgi:hypothetical protein